ncbi:uncharacterized protein LOC124369566 [Homalodisca vitripennis]|uniref:uncharacterized protein LOC124369566 n=1 Tax=Homalodisca vitripennis TaxID=197043 RepID=UPI001EEC0C89|nr:uncharacterized protein LOC124369566 [Homalodisca vitripennis]
MGDAAALERSRRLGNEEPKVKFIYQVKKELVKEPPLSVPEEQNEPQWIQPFTKEDLQLIDFENPLHLRIYVDSESAVVLRLRGEKPSISVRINTKGQLQVLWDKMTITLDVTWTTFSILHNLVHIQAKILSATNITLPAQSQFIKIMAEKILFGSYKEEDGNEYVSENVFRLSNAGLVKTTSINIPKMIGEVFCKSNEIEDAISLGTLIMLKKSSTQEHWRLGHNTNMIFNSSTGEVRIEKEGNSLIIKGSELVLTTNLNTEEALMRTVIDSEKEEIVIHNTVTKTKRVIERQVPHTVVMTNLKYLAKSNSELTEEVEQLHDKPKSADIADCSSTTATRVMLLMRQIGEAERS